ncbi:hypothetical protein A5821_000527 [Enterococcus sp. 7F3_DIV0205]|uniref:Uncharacterized protein n=1 Tax=Candidatus Enterococcus palustris TaxID=1834189 RepID=A0AAQ3WBP0_9ENTE|nr:LPXTG cell wall anchor domain-containing protein [Enterococcus sp. 7F3_DIV0205]OTN84940.1 hypothetical protein A5821_000869 [Enterococcus sp. 7F3_DIV0205]
MKGGTMKKKYVIFLSIIFITISFFQLFNTVEAVNYNTEIGLTFNSDVAAGSDSSSSAVSESSTNETLESTTTTSKKELPETRGGKRAKPDEVGFLPSTGMKNNVLYLLLGSLMLIIVFSYSVLKPIGALIRIPVKKRKK